MTSFERCRLNLKETVAPDQKVMLLFIQYEVAQEKSVADAYKSFCKSLGDDAMKYTDFDYWYYRFKDGKFDLDHDRSTDPPTAGLSDMPMDITENILNNLEWKDKCVARKVSRSFQKLINISKQYFKKITFSIDRAYVQLILVARNAADRHSVMYCNAKNGGVIVALGYEKQKKITNSNMWEAALNDLALILKNPKVLIGELVFGTKHVRFGEVEMNQFSKAVTIFRSLDHQISVKRFMIAASNEDEVLAVLPSLKPVVLEHFEIANNVCSSCINIGHIIELDQWKQAKTRTVLTISCSHVDQLFNLTEFDAKLTSFSKNDFIRLKNALRASPDFILGRVQCPEIDTEIIRIELGMELLTIEDNFYIVFDSQDIRFRKLTGFKKPLLMPSFPE